MNSTDKSPVLPRSLILLTGSPRSGIGLIGNAFRAHSEVTGVSLPPLDSTGAGAELPGLRELMRSADIPDPEAAPHLFLAETGLRTGDLDYPLDLMMSARRSGVYRGLVMVVRDPLAAYLSHVEAGGAAGLDMAMSGKADEALENWAETVRQGLATICRQARAHHFRLVSFEQFCANPVSELARLMALIPVALENGQLSFNCSEEFESVENLKLQQVAQPIPVRNRDDQIDVLTGKYGERPEMKFLLSLKEIVENQVGRESDRTTLDRITRLVF